MKLKAYALMIMAILSFLSFLIVAPSTTVNAVTETRNLQVNQSTVNTITGYNLNATALLGTGATYNSSWLDGSGKNITIGSDFYRVTSDGTKTKINGAVKVAQVYRSSNGEGVQSATWVCPQTALATTDAVIQEVWITIGNTSWTCLGTFITEQLGASQLDAVTWTVYYYTQRYWASGEGTTGYLYWGDTTHNSRIANFQWTSASGEPPTYSTADESPDVVLSGENITLSIYWTATTGNMSFARAEYNVTGSALTNSSWYTFPTGLSTGWANITITTPENITAETTFTWREYANNTNNRWNTTTFRSVTLWRGLPAVSKWNFGESAETPRGAYYEGAKKAIFVAYQNSTTDPWTFQIRAFDTNSSYKTTSYSLGQIAGTSDGHWAPDIAFLPDGRIIYMIAYGQLNGTYGLYYWLSKYSAKTESNLDTLIGSWEAQRVLGSGTNWAYPHAIWWDDRAFIHGRRSTKTYYTIFKAGQSINLYADGFDGTFNQWYTVGDSPYLDNGNESYIWIDNQDRNMGNFSFANMDNLVLDSTDMQVYLKIFQTSITGASNRTSVYLFNGTTDIDLGGTITQGWNTFNVTNILNSIAKVNDARFYIRSTVVTQINISIAKLQINYTGFSEPAYLSDFQYYDITKNGTNVLFAADWAYNSTQFAYSPDKGESWYLANGTAATLPLGRNQTEVYGNNLWQTYTLDPILDENSKPVIAVITRQNFNFIPTHQIGIVQYSGTLNSTGTWSFNYAEDEFGQHINGTDLGFLFDQWYKRPSIWTPNNRKLQKYVRMIGETYKFHSVWQDPNNYEWDMYGTVLKDSLGKYEIANREFWLQALGDTAPGLQQQLMNSTELWGTKFVANITTTLTVTRAFLNASLGSPKWQAAIYNETGSLIGNWTDEHPVSYASTETGWQTYASFLSPFPEITQGQEYWLWLRVTANNSVSYDYDTSTVINQTARYDATSFPSTLNPTEFYNRSISMFACPVYIVIRGLGVDDNPAFLSFIGTNTTARGQPVRFHTYVEDNSYLNKAGFVFGTNNTGSWINQSYTSFSVGLEYEAWANYSTTLNDTLGAVVQFQFWVNDSYSNWAATGLYNLTVVDNPPTYTYGNHTTTSINADAVFYIIWQDDITLNVSIFSCNITDTWTNQTVSLTGNPSWANVTKNLNKPIGTIVGYRWYTNDSANQWNYTIILTLTITSDDLIPPTWTYGSYNTTTTYQASLFYILWEDDVSLSDSAIFSTNLTDNWVNETAIFTAGWANKTKILNKPAGTIVGYRWYANDTSNNWNDTGILILVITEDLPPQYSNTGSSETNPASSCTFYALWQDDLGLEVAFFSWNNTGTWENYTLTISGVSSWANKTVTLDNELGKVIGYRWYANDTLGQWNTTSILILIITDTLPPFAFNNSVYTSTIINTTCSIDIVIWDNYNMSGFIFSHNNTGQWVNETWQLMVLWYLETPSACGEFVLTLNDTVGVIVEWKWYANDTSNNWASSGIYNLTTTEEEGGDGGGGGGGGGGGSTSSNWVIFVVCYDGKSVSGALIRLWTMREGNLIGSYTTDQGNATAELFAGSYNYDVEYQGVKQNGNFTYQGGAFTVRIDLNNAKEGTPISKPLLIRIALGLGIVFAIVIGVVAIKSKTH